MTNPRKQIEELVRGIWHSGYDSQDFFDEVQCEFVNKLQSLLDTHAARARYLAFRDIEAWVLELQLELGVSEPLDKLRSKIDEELTAKLTKEEER